MLVSTPGIPSDCTILLVLERVWMFCETKRFTAKRNSFTLLAPKRRGFATAGCFASTLTLLPVPGLTPVQAGRDCGPLAPLWRENQIVFAAIPEFEPACDLSPSA